MTVVVRAARSTPSGSRPIIPKDLICLLATKNPST